MADVMSQLRALANPDRRTVLKAEIAGLRVETHEVLDAMQLFGGRIAELNARRASKLDEWADMLDRMELS